MNPSPTSDAIQAAVREHAFRGEFSGVIRVERDGQVLFEHAAGPANRSDSLPNTPRTRFQIASGCKVFTAVTICRLVERGRLSLDSRLVDCLDEEFPRFDPGVTVRQLLTHTSGIPSYFDEEGGQDYEDIWKAHPMYAMRTPADFLPLFQDAPQCFPPGERFAYNDGGFVLLGLIAELLGGRPFADCVGEHVFGPAGMSDSGYFQLDGLPPNTAHAYIQDADGSWRTNQYAVPIVGGGDGGAFTTAADMGRFWRALFARELLGEELTAALLCPATDTGDDPDSTHYGLGVWILTREPAPPVHFVCGFDPGVNFVSSVHGGGRLVVTILCNTRCAPWGLDLAIARALE